MDMHGFCNRLSESLAANRMTVFGARCSIRYSGRAESFLDHGDRIILIKPDKTLLVHQSNGSTPVNYMKEGTNHDLTVGSFEAVLQSRNIASKEYLDITITRAHFIESFSPEDDQKIVVSGSEKDMADMIFANPHLIEQGFKPLSLEEHISFGFIDVFGHDKDNTLVIVECKRYCGDPDAVDQLRRYVEKVKRSKGLRAARGILACPRVTPGAQKMLDELGYEFRAIRPPKYLERFDRQQHSLFDFSAEP
jgi:hypothetical protein